MVKKILFVLVAGLLVAGCAQKANNGRVGNYNYDSKGARTFESIQRGKASEKTTANAVPSQACQSGDTRACKSFADSMYSKGDFSSAIKAYDQNCINNHIDSCVRMAQMFEKGEGAPQNINNAVDIYMRACYAGHGPSCKDMRRLGYKG